MSYELKDFRREVLEASEQIPVVLDFWAEWCGPCRQLSPVIEKLASEANGKWNLVKIDTDRNPEISAQMGIRGIPAVKMVYRKQIIAEFTGVLPEPQIKAWLREYLPGDSNEAGEDLFEQADLLIEQGERGKALSFLESQFDGDEDDEFRTKMAMLLLPSRLDRAKEWMNRIEDREKFDILLETVETVDHIAQIARGEVEPQGEDQNGIKLYKEGAMALMREDFEEAIKKFIAVLEYERSLDEDGARKACVACFTLLGDRHPLTSAYRRKFSMALY